MRTLSAAEFAVLARLRAGFLDGSARGGASWRSAEELALYDETFAERIGWKLDAVLAELSARGWSPRSRCVVDFGCGSGVAARRVIGAWESFDFLSLVDASALAVDFAAAAARRQFPKLEIRADDPAQRGGLLLVSHVLNELAPAARAALLARARLADEIIWVEAGSHADSRALIAVREELRGEFAVVAPCTHAAPCGMLAAENAPHWCHQFARVPSGAFQDAGWAEFSRTLGIDLRALPYSFLVMQREPVPETADLRIIGPPREAKGRMELLCCDSGGVAEHMLQKRDAPDLFRNLQKGRAAAVQSLHVEDGRLRVLDSAGDARLASAPSP